MDHPPRPPGISPGGTGVSGASGKDLARITQEEFPLPEMGPSLAKSLEELLHGRGFLM